MSNSNTAEQLPTSPTVLAVRGDRPIMTGIHLKGKGYSGRGVRYRVLRPSELDRNEVVASKSLDQGYSKEEYLVEISRIGLAQMIVSYTDVGAKEIQNARWYPADQALLDRAWDTIFTTRDTLVLRHVFQVEHGVGKDELEAILAGKVEVLAD